MSSSAESCALLLKSLLELGYENDWIEFKVNNDNPEEIGKYISALSNSACLAGQKKGYLVFGVESESRKIVGTAFEPFTAKRGNEQLQNWIANRLDPRIDFAFLECRHGDKRVVLLEIDTARGRPVRFMNDEWVRIGSTTRKLSDFPEKARKIWTIGAATPYEYDTALSVDSPDGVLGNLEYESYYVLTELPKPNDMEVILSTMADERVVVRRRDRYDITNLGAILFARDLRTFEKLQRKAVRVINYVGTDRRATRKEQCGQRGYAAGFVGLVNYIMDRLPAMESIPGALRVRTTAYPKIAIRELVANALIHQDFSATGTGPMIEIFSDRVEISNPGRPLIDTRRFIDHNPVSRNEQLASLMRRLNICEERGSGIDKVIFAVEEYQLPPPRFEQDADFTRVVLFSSRPLKNMTRDDKTLACYQHCALKYISQDPMSNASLRQRFGISAKNYSIASRIIADSIQDGLIREMDPRSQSKKFTRYIPFWA